MLQYFCIHVCLFYLFNIQKKVLVLVVHHSVPLECGPNAFTGAKHYEALSDNYLVGYTLHDEMGNP
jgi:hypothetical protein